MHKTCAKCYACWSMHLELKLPVRIPYFLWYGPEQPLRSCLLYWVTPNYHI